MEKRRPISYNFEDIKRYKQGLMNREEMHAFEKASMEDPFLADALEGYMEADMAQAEQHLHNIRERIADKESKQDKAVVVSMPKRSFAMWRVAAMIIVIAGAGLLTYKIFDKEKITTDPLAHKETKPGINADPVTPDNTTALASDTIGSSGSSGDVKVGDDKSTPALAHIPSSTEDNLKGKAEIEADNAVKKTNDIAALKEGVAKTSASKTNTIEKQGKASASIISTEEKDNVTQNRNPVYNNQSRNNEIRGRILNPSNQPLANANVTLDHSRRSFVTDPAGNFNFNVNDTVVTATVAIEGYDNTRVQLRSNTDNTINLGNIALQPDATFDEVVVIGLGTDKTRVTDTISNKPLGGWQSFQEYVANKLNTVVDTTGGDMKMSGEIELEFYVDAKGAPRDFKILNATATNATISRQAIEAVKKGPKWETRRKKARLLILY